jgi:hypothetical protein
MFGLTQRDHPPNYASREFDMSMELYVLSSGLLASMKQWQRAIDTEGFALQLPVKKPIDQLKGLLPVTSGRTETGFECDHWDPRDLKTIAANINFENWRHVLAFRWGADFNAGAAAYMAATAYARATSGVVFDCEEGAILTPDRTAEIVRELKQAKPLIEEAVRRVKERFKPTR